MSFDETVDFLVVGSGAGSMVGALCMRDQGHRTVVLEKAELLGGTTCKSGGVMWIPNNRFMKRDGVEDSLEAGRTYVNAVLDDQLDTPGSTPVKREAYLTQAPEMLNYLVDKHGVRLTRVHYWPDYYDDLPGGCSNSRTVMAELFDLKQLGPWHKKMRRGFLPLPLMLGDAMNLPAVKREWPARWMLLRFIGRLLLQLITGKRRVAAGAALQGWLLKSALAAGVEVRTQSPVTELIVEDGAVRGVCTERNGKAWRIESRHGVLVTAGGFANNAEMRAQYQPGTSTDWSNAVESDTGDLIKEMMRLGAAVNNMDMMVGYQSTMLPGKEQDYVKPGAQKITAAPHVILVDQTGVRYQNEGGSYVAFCRGMLDRNSVAPSLPSWGIMDSQAVAKYGVAGVKSKSKLDKLAQSGYLKRAADIESLAQALNIDPATLRATVDRFNGFVANNCDEDFGRGHRHYDRWLGDRYHQPSQTLGAIEQGPFYAIPIVPGDVGTYGGVVTDEHARVLREDGSVIAGLYASGVCTASVFGRFYPGAGASIGPAVTFGYIAGQHAAAAAGKAG